ncbi:MAG: DUF599 family protein [Thermoplasmatota archaeon]
MISNEMLDIIAFIIFLICITIFAGGLVYKIKHPRWGERGYLNIMYQLWVKRMSNSTETIVAIQTLRNLIMIITFLSTSMLLLLGLLLPGLYTGAFGIIDPAFGQYKLIIFVAVIVFSVIMFLLSLRQIVRLLILIGIPLESFKTISADYMPKSKNTIGKGNKKISPCYIDAEKLKIDVFLRAMNRFTFGLRAIFFGIVITLWFVNTYAFIIGTIWLTMFFVIRHDVEPCDREEMPL